MGTIKCNGATYYSLAVCAMGKISKPPALVAALKPAAAVGKRSFIRDEVINYLKQNKIAPPGDNFISLPDNYEDYGISSRPVSVAPDRIVDKKQPSISTATQVNVEQRRLWWMKRVRKERPPKEADDLKQAVLIMSERTGLNPNYVLNLIAIETKNTFNPAIQNPITGATGYIQLMDEKPGQPGTAAIVGTSTEKLQKMPPLEHMIYVEKYFDYNKKIFRIEKSFSEFTMYELYMLVFAPKFTFASNDTLVYSGEKAHKNQYYNIDNDKDHIYGYEIFAKVDEKIKLGVSYEGY